MSPLPVSAPRLGDALPAACWDNEIAIIPAPLPVGTASAVARMAARGPAAGDAARCAERGARDMTPNVRRNEQLEVGGARSRNRLVAAALSLSLLLTALVVAALALPATALAAGEHDSHSNGWTEFMADTITLSGGSYYLSGDVEYSGTESITVSGEVILCLNGHKLDLNKQHISVGSGASLTLCDCSTGGVLTGGSDIHGGGVYVGGGGTFTMTGGNITGNTADAGGGVYVYKGGTFTMEGGSINNNTTTSGGGGGVMIYEGTFTLSGGSITGNATNDETVGSGGGVCLYGTFYLSGDAIIQDNTKAGTADNLYLGWQTINIAGPLGESAHIGVNAENVPRSFISGWSDNMAGENPADYFSSDGDALGIGLDADGNVVLGSLCTIITQPADKSVIEGETATFTVNAAGSELLSYQWQQRIDNGNNWTNIASANAAEYTTGKTTMDMSGNQYRCVVTGDGGAVISDPATLTVTHAHKPSSDWSSDADGHWHACAACGGRLDYAAHTPKVEGAQGATCTEEGYTGDTVCSVCGYVIEEGETIPAAGHAWSEPAWRWSDDGEEFVASFACENDPSHTLELTAAPTSEVASEPTCIEPGTTRYRAEVELDGVTYAAEATAADIPALGHRFEDGVCTVCGAEDEGYVAPQRPDPRPEPEPVETDPELPTTGDATAVGLLGALACGGAALGIGAALRMRSR